MILSQHNFKPEALLRFFKQRFPEKDWFYLDMYSDEDTTHFLKSNSMGFYLVENYSKAYPLEINLTETDEDVIADYQTKVAKNLSQNFEIKTVIDFVHPDKQDDPFYSLLFDSGTCFLVDDSEWEEKEEFIIIEPWPLP
ncbi:MAG: hypothetical protein AB8B59_11295 [Maribacter sp.]